MSIIELIGEDAEIRVYTGEVASGDCAVYDGKRDMQAIAGRLKKERKGGKRWARAVAVVDGVGFDVETGERVELVECGGDELKLARVIIARHNGRLGKGKPKTKKTNYAL